MSRPEPKTVFQEAPHLSLKAASLALEELLSQEKDIRESFAFVEELFPAPRSPLCEKDLKAIAVSIDKLFDLAVKLRVDVSQEDPSENDWSVARHDLRANVGCIKGYGEIFVEEGLTDPKAIATMGLLVEKAKALLGIVERVRMDSYGVQESAALEEYPSCFIGATSTRGVILIIDDDEEKRRLIVRRLQDAGHETIEAQSGREGLDILKKQKIDLILLDILMPGMSGHEVLRVLKSNLQTMHIPVLVISSLQDEGSAIQCIRAGADDFLSSPVNPTLLQARVSACLLKKQLGDTEKQQAEELLATQKRLEAALESIDVGFAIFDRHERLSMVNQSFRVLYPCAQEVSHIFSYEYFLTLNYNQGLYEPERRGVSSGEDLFLHWLKDRLDHFRRADGEPLQERLSDQRWVEIVHNPIPMGGTATVHKDITFQKRREESVLHRANHDALTGLMNRAYFERSLDELCAEEEEFSLLYADLDGFKAVNDTLGHAFGDYLLTTVARKLKSVFREEDLIARLGGDEFCVLLPRMHAKDFLKNVANRCLESIGDHVEKNGVRAHFGVSLGIASFPFDARDGKTLIECADTAMYHAKKSGKGHFVFFGDLHGDH